MNAFNRYHPFLNFIFFGGIIVFTMAFMNPIFLLISFIFSLGYAISLEGKEALILLFKVIPISFLSIFVNVLFNHRGSTIVFYFSNGNPFTLESLIFGVSASFMILSTIFWFYSFHRIVTTDKLLYIFGKMLSSFSLLLSMVLRFVPKLAKETREMVNGQKCLGEGNEKQSLKKRFLMAKSVLSAEITLAFENAMDTATSMRMRGFHEKKRKIYAIYQMSRRDRILGVVFLMGFLFLFWGIHHKYAYYRYFPSFQWEGQHYESWILIGIYAFLVSIPLLLEIGEMIKWRRLK